MRTLDVNEAASVAGGFSDFGGGGYLSAFGGYGGSLGFSDWSDVGLGTKGPKPKPKPENPPTDDSKPAVPKPSDSTTTTTTNTNTCNGTTRTETTTIGGGLIFSRTVTECIAK